MRKLLYAASIAALLFGAPPAGAHAFLAKADPPVGASLKLSPRTLRLAFTEALELPFSGIAVLNGAGRSVTISNLRLDAGDASVLIADVPPLAPGQYRVKWHAVSVDTHRTEGDFTFTVKP